eukprot:TRINITY_DN13393_c0_g1_i1.p1 TRINITY_DN13393_c0_g1~~TRINITY_DN13393_c0_g1_i1.p1  ORF type:complete len:168 (+),score=57.86 TRINITY_DN13393_c0_g1_i1:87-590(+)
MALPRRQRAGSQLLLLGTAVWMLSGSLDFALPSRMNLSSSSATQVHSSQGGWGAAGILKRHDARPTPLVARQIFGLGTSEILVILGAAILFFGPETLKGVAKEAGKAAGDLKDVPEAFQKGMEETDKTKSTETKDGEEGKDKDSKKEEEGKDKDSKKEGEKEAEKKE